ncbi:hypothetical protein Tco_0438305, partial [Tanacetum coccineum]
MLINLWGRASYPKLEELDRLRNDLQRAMQTHDGLSKQLSLLDSVHSSCEDKERELVDQLKEMEKERDDWRRTASEQSEDEIAAVLSETKNLDIEGSKTWKYKHRELFTKQYPYIQRVAKSYRVPLDAMLQVFPDPPTADIRPEPSTEANTGNVATQVPPSAQTAKAT